MISFAKIKMKFCSTIILLLYCKDRSLQLSNFSLLRFTVAFNSFLMRTEKKLSSLTISIFYSSDSLKKLPSLSPFSIVCSSDSLWSSGIEGLWELSLHNSPINRQKSSPFPQSEATKKKKKPLDSFKPRLLLSSTRIQLLRREWSGVLTWPLSWVDVEWNAVFEH